MSKYVNFTSKYANLWLTIRLLMVLGLSNCSQFTTSVSPSSDISFITNATTIAQALDQCLKVNLPCACLNLNIINYAAFPHNSISAHVCHTGCITNKECLRTINNCDKSRRIPFCNVDNCRRECWCQCNTQPSSLTTSPFILSSRSNHTFDFNKHYYKCHLYNSNCRTQNKLEDSMWGVFGLILLIGTILTVVLIGHNYHRIKVVWNNLQVQSQHEVIGLINSTENPQNHQAQISLQSRIEETSISNISNPRYQDTRLNAPLPTIDGPPTYAQAIHNSQFIAELKPIFSHHDEAIDLPSYEETCQTNVINNDACQTYN